MLAACEPLPSHDSFAIMEEFADSLPDSRFKERLFRALNQRHPFRNFKDALCDDDDQRQAFFAFRDQRLCEYARQWLKGEEIDAELIERQPANLYLDR